MIDRSSLNRVSACFHFGMVVSALSLLALVPVANAATESGENVSVSSEELYNLEITFPVDGSGKLIFTGYDIIYENISGDPPKQGTFGGEAWEEMDKKSPARWSERLGRRVDLSRVKIVARSARDVLWLEHTTEGCEVYFADTPPGEATYKFTLQLPLVR